MTDSDDDIGADAIRDADAAAVGRMLEGFGVNLLVSDVARAVEFLSRVLQFEVVRQSSDYAVLAHRRQLYQLHADSTYAANPLPSLLPEVGARGGGVELRLYRVDPDRAERRAREHGYEVLQRCADKPHGLRECFLLDPDGYCWVPSSPLAKR
ncbi:MAG: VOC family protein [bacterium]